MSDELRISTIDQVREEQRRQRLDRYVATMTSIHKHGRDYTNFIIVAGFVGFFTLWGGMAGDVAPLLRDLAGGMVGLSLALFVGWEIFQALLRINAAGRVGAVLGASEDYPADFETKWDAALARNARDDMRAFRIWPFVFWPTVVLGLLGALVMVIAALSGPLHVVTGDIFKG